MAYKVRATRREDGGYDLSYGKGRRKLTAIMYRYGTAFKVEIGVEDMRGTLKALKERWGKWAESMYNLEPPLATGPAPREFPPPPSTVKLADRMQVVIDGQPRKYVRSSIEKVGNKIAHTIDLEGGAMVALIMTRDAAVDFVNRMATFLEG